jgi:hypothetical protein
MALRRLVEAVSIFFTVLTVNPTIPTFLHLFVRRSFKIVFLNLKLHHAKIYAMYLFLSFLVDNFINSNNYLPTAPFQI